MLCQCSELQNGNLTEWVGKGRVPHCYQIPVDTKHGPHQHPQTECGHVLCRCDTHPVNMEMMPWLYTWWTECHAQGQKWPFGNIKHNNQWHWRHGACRQSCFATGIRAGIQPPYSNVCALSTNVPAIAKCAVDKCWNNYLTNRSTTEWPSHWPTSNTTKVKAITSCHTYAMRCGWTTTDQRQRWNSWYWKHFTSPAKEKIKTTVTNRKAMAISVWDIQKIILGDFTINQSFIFRIILYRQNQRFGNSHKKIYILEVVSIT